MPIDGEAGGVASHNPAFYSFDIGNIHFLSLDSYGIEDDRYRIYDTLGPQVQWIKKDLEANAHKGWVIAYWHHQPYTMGSHNSDHEQELVHIRENFIQVLERSRLLKGHYGMETTFAPWHNVSNSSGRYDTSSNSCPYLKDSATGYTGQTNNPALVAATRPRQPAANAAATGRGNPPPVPPQPLTTYK